PERDECTSSRQVIRCKQSCWRLIERQQSLGSGVSTFLFEIPHPLQLRIRFDAVLPEGPYIATQPGRGGVYVRRTEEDANATMPELQEVTYGLVCRRDVIDAYCIRTREPDEPV